MATLDDLEAAIDALLEHPSGGRRYQLVSRTEPKAYEAYVFGLCLRAVRELGGVPSMNGISGTPTPFIFRGGPGQIHGTRRNYGYASFRIRAEDFELHAGIEFRGSSGMTHELDVAILRAADARQCRLELTDPGSAALVAGWECKFYADDLDKVLGRAFVGLMDDMGTNVRLSGMCSNADSAQLRTYMKPMRRPYAQFLLTPARASNEATFVGLLKATPDKLAG
jgi:hypothetical protein